MLRCCRYFRTRFHDDVVNLRQLANSSNARVGIGASPAIGVTKDLRNQGIGTLLLERLLADCRRRFPGVSLSVREDNPVVRLYERLALGFRQVGAAFTNRVGALSTTMLVRFD